MTPSRHLVRTLMASAAIVVALTLAGCETDNPTYASRAMKPLPEAMLAEIQKKNMAKDSPILVRLFKEEAELEVWKEDRTGRFALLKTYPICRWSGDLGPKIKEGDRQAPEGFYSITRGQMNPNSEYYLSFNLGFPNAYDQAWGRTGAHLMVHGDCSSRGCYAMTDEQITEIYALGRESFFGGQRSFQSQLYPFRMTPANLAKHRNSPHFAFWKMLKTGNDHFEATHLEPKVDVCEKRYVFNAAAPAGSSTPMHFNNKGKCPVYEVPKEIADAVNEKQRRDDIQLAGLIARNTPTVPARAGVDGGMNPLFAAALGGQELGDGNGNIRALASLPKSIPIIRLPRDSGAATRQTAPGIRMPEPGATPVIQPEPTETAVASLPTHVPVPRAAPEPKDEEAAPVAVATVRKPALPPASFQTAKVPESESHPVPQPAPRPLSQPSTMQVASVAPATAPARPAAQPSLFNNLFGAKAAPAPDAKPQVQAAVQPQPEPKPQVQAPIQTQSAPRDSVTARPSSAAAPRSSEKPLDIAAPPVAAAKPAAPKSVPSTVAQTAPVHGAIRPQPAPVVGQKEPKRQAPPIQEAKPEPIRPPVRTASREAPVATFSSASLLAGAQATVPVGSFR